ncbi:hypothetical protein ACXR2U_15800 [Jatrophihabitans sp. YIM 134969]
MAPPSTTRLLRRGIAATAVAGLAVAGVATAGPAAAAGSNGSSSVTLSATAANTNGRTLVLNALSGDPLSTSSGLTATGGAAGFITGVADANYSNFGYSVQSTMTNLYKVTGANTYSCTDFIPSSAVSVVENGALDLTNIAATVQPLFNLSGTLLGTINVPSTPLTGNSKALNATALLGATTGALTDIADGSLTGLPVKAALGVGSTETPYTNAAAFGLGNGCTGSASPTSNPLLAGTSNNAGVKSVVTNALNALGTGSSFNAGNLIAAGYSTVDAVKALAAPLVGGLGALAGLNIAPLNATLTALSQVTQSGNYQVSPTLKVNVPATASGDYTGVMTVTLTDV